MNEHRAPEYRVMLTTDIEDYSRRSDAGQQTLQEGLDEALNCARDGAAISRVGWHVQTNGDSVFAVLPSGTDVAQLMDRFIRELDAALGSYNRRREGPAWSRMRLRLAVHAGVVHLYGPTGWPGQHAVVPVRLRDSEPVRAALGALRAADLAVIVSADVYRDYITQGPGDPRPTEFRAVLVKAKDRTYVGHLLVPGYDLHAVGSLDQFELTNADRHHPVPESGPEPRGGRGKERRTQVSADPPRGRPDPATAARAGRDVIFGDQNRVTGGDVYRAGRDLNVLADPSSGSHDE